MIPSANQTRITYDPVGRREDDGKGREALLAAFLIFLPPVLFSLSSLFLSLSLSCLFFLVSVFFFFALLPRARAHAHARSEGRIVHSSNRHIRQYDGISYDR